MNHLLSCQEWADRLITNHAEALSPSDYLVLKEHLLTCPHCMATHRNYLVVEAQIRSLPVLQPQRYLSANLLREPEMHKVRQTQPASMPLAAYALHKRAALIIAAYITPLKNLEALLRRPGYVLVTLFFCLVTTVAAVGTVNQISLRHTPSPSTQNPHLAVSTTGLALSVTSPLPSTVSASPTVTQTALLVARGTLMLRNPGKLPLSWRFNRAKSFVVYKFSSVTLWTQPANGILQSNQHSPIQVIASGISYESLSFNHTIELGYIVLTSNEGDVSVQTTLKTTSEPAQKNPSAPHPFSLKMSNPAPPSQRLQYTLRKQSVWQL